MSFDEIIEQQRQNERQASERGVEFITVYELFIAMQKRYPDQSLDKLCGLLFTSFNQYRPVIPLYSRRSSLELWREFEFIPKWESSRGGIVEVPLLRRITNGRYNSPEEMFTSVKTCPLDEAELDQFAMRRVDVNSVLGIDIEKSPAPAVSDYVAKLEQENAELRTDIQRMKESYQPPALRGESYAASREEIFIAVMGLLHDLDLKGKLKPGSNGLCLPNATKLEDLLHQNQTLFWPDAGRSPVTPEKIKDILREAAGLLRERGNPNLEQRRKKRKKIKK